MSSSKRWGISPTQYRIVKLAAAGESYPRIAELTGSNARLCRHHADVAARLLLPKSTLPTRQRLTLWWERRKG